METQKIFNLLNKTDLDSKKFTTKRWYIIDTPSQKYDAGEAIKFDAKVIKPNLCDYSEACILVTGTINNIDNAGGKIVCLKNCAPFRTCTSRINDEHLEQAEDLDIASPVYNLIEYSDNYEDSTGSLYQFKRDEITTGDDANVDIVANNSKPFAYKANLVGEVPANPADNKYEVKIVVPLKFLSNFLGHWKCL